MKKEALICSVAHQKGGVGKSTITAILATAIHARTNKKVLVIDCDYQGSLISLREKELEDDKKAIVSAAAYPIVAEDPENIFEVMGKYIEDYDIIFIDMPGNIKQKGIIDLFLLTHVIIIPLVANELDVDSTIKFVEKCVQIQNMKKEEGENLRLMGIMNKFSMKKENRMLVDFAEALDIELFENFLRNNVRYDRKISTMVPMGSVMDEEDEVTLVTNEFIKKLNL